MAQDLGRSIDFDPQKIASYALQEPKHPEVELSQVKHRIDLIKAWGIQPGARVLEIGCGQGNCTTVLAEAVGLHGHVDAIDPAPGDYGAPFTLEQAQAHITASKIGNQITWHRADPLDFLLKTTAKWDVVVLSHCIWYFKSSDTLPQIFSELKGKTLKIAIAEYAMDYSVPASLPHVLAATARATLEVHKKDSEANVQNIMGPVTIRKIALEDGLIVERENFLAPDVELDDGRWEVGEVIHAEFVKEIESTFSANDRIAWLLRSMRDNVIDSVERIGGLKAVRTMNVWAVVFIR